MKIELTAKHIVGLVALALFSMLTFVFLIVGLIYWTASSGNNSASSAGQGPPAAPAASVAMGSDRPGSGPGNRESPINTAQSLPAANENVVKLIRANDFAQLKSLCDAARANADIPFLLDAYRSACDQGSAEALRAVGRITSNPSPKDMDDILSAVEQLSDRPDSAALRLAMSQFSQQGVSSEREILWLEQQFNRQPWDQDRFQRIADASRTMVRAVPKLLRVSLDGPEAQFDWMKTLLRREQNAQYQGAILQLLQEPDVAHERNADRIIELIQFSRLSPEQSLLKVAPYLQPKHFEFVRKALQGKSIPPALMDYVFKQDAQLIAAWSEQDPNVRFGILQKTNAVLGQTEPEEALAQLEPLLPLVQLRTKLEDKWDPYASLVGGKSPRLDWLWKNAVRPPTSAIGSQLFLAIRYQDKNLLKQVLQHPSQELNRYLNGGIYLRDAAGTPEMSQAFVPVLEVIRSWDLDAAKMLIDTRAHNWDSWQYENPLLLAVTLKKQEVFAYLMASGAKWDEKSRQSLVSLPDVDKSVLDSALPSTGTEAFRVSLNVMSKAIRSDDLQELEDGLKRFHASQKRPKSINYNQTLMNRRSYPRETRALQEIRVLMEAAVTKPAMFERLQFEGFPVTIYLVQKILQAENRQSLEIALRDTGVRRELRRNAVGILAALQDKPAIVEHYAELGMLDQLPEDQQKEAAYLYKTITGKTLPKS